MTTTDERTLRYIDSDGHILEPPTAMLDFAPAEYRDRIWHLETDADGIEYSVWNGRRMPSTGLAGTAGFSDEDVDRVRNGELNYSQTRPSGWTASLRLADMETDGIDVSVLYPTTMLGLQSMNDVEFGRVQARVVQRLVRRAPEGGRGAPVRRRRAPADPRTRRRAGCGRRDPARGRARRGWCRSSCGRTRRSSGATSTTPCTTPSGRHCRTPSSPWRSTRSSRPTSRARATG